MKLSLRVQEKKFSVYKANYVNSFRVAQHLSSVVAVDSQLSVYQVLAVERSTDLSSLGPYHVPRPVTKSGKTAYFS